jgi:hypothetical protein
MRYPHMQQIKIRLSFLEFLLVNSSSTLTAAQVPFELADTLRSPFSQRFSLCHGPRSTCSGTT